LRGTSTAPTGGADQNAIDHSGIAAWRCDPVALDHAEVVDEPVGQRGGRPEVGVGTE